MLTADEQTLLDEAAKNGETGLAIEFMRHLATIGRVGDMAAVIDRFQRAAEVNRSALRAFLANRVPGILVNHHFPRLANYQQFINWSVREPGWADGLIAAANACTPDGLEAEVTKIRNIVARIGSAPITAAAE